MTITETKKYKVLIPTAGIGSRLNNLTKYLNKSLISIQNKPAISRIIDMFPDNTEFVIALGYKGDLVRQFLKLAYPDKNFLFAQVEKYEGEGSGLGLTILSCEKYLQEPFIFCSCDTIVKEKIPYPDKNIIGFAKRDNKIEYRTVDVALDKVIGFYEKTRHTTTSQAYIGLACIHDWKLFWDEMHNGGEESIKIGESYPLLKFAQNHKLFAKEFTWFDTGNLIELEKTQQYFKEENAPNILQKENESIWFVNDRVIKYSDDKKFISDRISRAAALGEFVPQIIDFTENMYAYKKVDGFVLSKIKDVSLFEKLLDFSKLFWNEFRLSDEDSKCFYDTCQKFYYTKTIDRINLYYKTFNVEDGEKIINGIKMPKLSTILQKVNWENIFKGVPVRFHGDFHFENILYDEKSDKFTFLDWRQNFGSSILFGDIYYDLAKLLHGLIICHELIAQDKFAVNIQHDVIEYSFERKEILIECEKYFYTWLEKNGFDVKKVKVLTALIYLNIAALHHYPYCHLLYYLGKKMLYENIGE